MTAQAASLIGKLAAIQTEKGMSDPAFAATLGISKAGWQGLRAKRFPPGRRALGKIMTAYPQLAPEVMACIVSTDTWSNETPD